MYQSLREPGRYVTISDVARYMRTSWWIARRISCEKGFPKKIKIGTRTYWLKDDVLDFISKNMRF